MENPVVVFVLPDRCGAQNLLFPTGWTEQGECLNGADAISNKNCCVILLADDQAIPQCNHANKARDQPLPVITHESSTLYTMDTIAGSELKNWGMPVQTDKFSHNYKSGNGIFKQILDLLVDPSGANAFAQKRRIANYLDVLDQIAAFCQICIIDQNAFNDDDSTWYDLLNNLPGDEFRQQLDAAQEGKNWLEALGIIATRANALSA